MSEILTTHFLDIEKCANCGAKYTRYPHGILRCPCGFIEDSY